MPSTWRFPPLIKHQSLSLLRDLFLIFSGSFHFYLVNAVWVLRFIHRTSRTSAPGAPLSFLDSKDDSLPRRPRGRIPSAMYRDGRPQMRNDRNSQMISNDESKSKWWIKWWIKKFDCDQSVSWHSMVSLIQNHRSRMVKDGQGWSRMVKDGGRQRLCEKRTLHEMFFPDQATELSDGHPETQPTSEVISPTTPRGPQIGDSKTCQQMLLTSWQVEFLARLTSVHSLLPFGPLFAPNGLISEVPTVPRPSHDLPILDVAEL